MRGERRIRWSTKGKQERERLAARSIGMARLDTSKAAELRMLAEKFRRRANDMTLLSYVKLMRQAAVDLDAEAALLDEEQPMPLGRHLDIRI